MTPAVIDSGPRTKGCGRLHDYLFVEWSGDLGAHCREREGYR